MDSTFISSIVCRKCDRYLNVVNCISCNQEDCEYCHNNTCKASISIDSLCDDFEKLSNYFDELEELKKFIDYEFVDIYILNKTAQRYERYLDNIKVWEIKDTSCVYIRDGILLFMNKIKQNIYDKSLVNLMRSIDVEILSLLNQY